MTPGVLVIGGGYAGLTAAARIAEDPAGPAVTLVDEKPGFVERIRLHEIAAGSRPRDLTYSEFMGARGGQFVQGRVTLLDTSKRMASVALTDGGIRDIRYDSLVYALGSHTDRTAVPGLDAHTTCLDTLSETTALFEKIQAGDKILIVGGGLTAIEAACEMAERLPGVEVVLAAGRAFGPSQAPGGLSHAGFDHICTTFDRLGVRTLSGARVTEVHAGAASLDDGTSVPFDHCIWAAGFIVADLASRAGISVNDAGQILTEPGLVSVSHSDIVAVGDAAEVIVEPAGVCRMSCAAGRPMGELAAKTVLATTLATTTNAGTPAFEFAYSFRCISLGRDDGLIQFVDTQDVPREEVWTGARGARWKEYICQRTLNGIGFEMEIGPPPDTPPQAP